MLEFVRSDIARPAALYRTKYGMYDGLERNPHGDDDMDMSAGADGTSTYSSHHFFPTSR